MTEDPHIYQYHLMHSNTRRTREFLLLHAPSSTHGHTDACMIAYQCTLELRKIIVVVYSAELSFRNRGTRSWCLFRRIKPTQRVLFFLVASIAACSSVGIAGGVGVSFTGVSGRGEGAGG